MTGTVPSSLSPEQERLQRDYRPAFLRYLSRRDEPTRHAGYLLGRQAVVRSQSMLDILAAHHVTLIEVLPDARDPAEVLASYSMASSAFTELRAQLQRAQERLEALRPLADGGSPTD